MIRPNPRVRRSAGIAALALVAGGLSITLLPVGPALSRAVAEDAAAPATPAGAYEVDAVHSTVLFRIKHMDVAYFWGRFNDFSGHFLLDGAAPENSAIDITIQVGSVDTANEGRDKHICSPDFFNVEQFSTATFRSTSVRKTGDKVFEVTGDLTLNGTTKPLTVTINNTGEGEGRGGSKIAGMESVFEFKRSDFSLGKPGGLGNEVRMTVSLEGGHK